MAFFSKADKAPENEGAAAPINIEQSAPVNNTISNIEGKTIINYEALFQHYLKNQLIKKHQLQFAYFLHKFQYVREYEQNDDNFLAINIKVNFCNNAKLTPLYNDMRNRSRSYQQLTADMFSDAYTNLWTQKENLPDSLIDKCNYCKGKGEGDPCQSVCPYFLAHIISKFEDPESFYKRYLGDSLIDFRGPNVKNITASIDPKILKKIDSKTAHAAYTMLASKFFKVISKSSVGVIYEYLPVCNKNIKGNMINNIYSFWTNGGNGQKGIFNIETADDHLKKKNRSCKNCEFDQCIPAVAAYIVYLADQYNCDPIDLAYYIAKNSTYAGVTLNQNYQLDKYKTIANKAPMSNAEKDEFLKMIHFIVSRKKNYHIPFLPFNLAITAPDNSSANEISDAFVNAVWFFDYFGVGSNNTLHSNLYFSSCGIQELLEQYKTVPKGRTFILYDIELLCESKEFMVNYRQLLKIMEDRKNEIFTIISGERENINKFFAKFPEFTKIFNKRFNLTHIDNRTVFEKLNDKLLESFTVTELMENRLNSYVAATYPSSDLKNMQYVDDTYEKIVFNHYNQDINANDTLTETDIPYVEPPRSEKEIFEELNKLVGLDNVKKELADVNALVKFNLKMGENTSNAINMHMVFSGNPGTGKTTVARLTAEILHSIGFIQENKLVVCSAKDLIGEYMGQTTPKTAKKCEEAYNGVLFIDEAYQLNPYTSNNVDLYKEECIAELIQQMENNRDKLVVIFAGYSKEMLDFLEKANTGLKSRIGRNIEFVDYNSDELLNIFERIVENHGMTITDDARAKAKSIIERASRDTEKFGNARFARNLFERSLLQHAALTADIPEGDPALLQLDSNEIIAP